MPAPVSPWKYSWKSSRSRHSGSSRNFAIEPATGRWRSSVRQPDRDETRGEVRSDVTEAHPLPRAVGCSTVNSSWRLVPAQQRLDEQVVDQEPDRPAPVRVAAEQPGGRFAGSWSIEAVCSSISTWNGSARWRRDSARSHAATGTLPRTTPRGGRARAMQAGAGSGPAPRRPAPRRSSRVCPVSSAVTPMETGTGRNACRGRHRVPPPRRAGRRPRAASAAARPWSGSGDARSRPAAAASRRRSRPASSHRPLLFNAAAIRTARSRNVVMRSV